MRVGATGTPAGIDATPRAAKAAIMRNSEYGPRRARGPSMAGAARRIRALSVAGALGIVAAGSVLQPVARGLGAQSTRSGETTPTRRVNDHRIRYLLTGVGIGGLLALGYYQMSDGGKRSGKCQPVNCALPYLTISGGIAGLFFAQEAAAQRRAEMPRAGDALEFRFTEIGLPAAASSIGVRDSIVAIATDSGAQVLDANARPVALRRRGAGLSNLRSVAIGAPGSADPRLFIGTGTALWETPLTTGLLARVMEGPVDALAAQGDVVVAAFGSKVRVRRTVSGAARVDSVDAGQPITAARYDATSGRWWLTSDSALFELTVTEAAPVLVQRAGFSGVARAVASSANWVAVALGSDGLAIWPRTSLGGSGVVTPIVLRGEPRFAFDLAFLGDALFVAGGVDGVTRVELGAGARIVGSSRQAGYATAIIAEDGVLWVGDRSKNRVLRIVP